MERRNLIIHPAVVAVEPALEVRLQGLACDLLSHLRQLFHAHGRVLSVLAVCCLQDGFHLLQAHQILQSPQDQIAFFVNPAAAGVDVFNFPPGLDHSLIHFNLVGGKIPPLVSFPVVLFAEIVAHKLAEERIFAGEKVVACGTVVALVVRDGKILGKALAQPVFRIQIHADADSPIMMGNLVSKHPFHKPIEKAWNHQILIFIDISGQQHKSVSCHANACACVLDYINFLVRIGTVVFLIVPNHPCRKHGKQPSHPVVPWEKIGVDGHAFSLQGGGGVLCGNHNGQRTLPAWTFAAIDISEPPGIHLPFQAASQHSESQRNIEIELVGGNRIPAALVPGIVNQLPLQGIPAEAPGVKSIGIALVP